MIKYFLKYTDFIVLFVPFILPLVSLDWLDSKKTICLYSNLTEQKCYGCGITKSIISISHFNFIRAYSYNKLIILVGPLLIIVWVKRWFKFIKIYFLTKS